MAKGHENVLPYRWKPGQSGNLKGRPTKEHTLRWYLEGGGLEVKITHAFYRNAMFILGMHQEVQAYDALVVAGAKAGDRKFDKVVPKTVKNFCFGEYCSLVAWYEAGKDPELFIKLIDQVHGKPVQPTTVANPDGSSMKGNVLVINVPADEDD